MPATEMLIFEIAKIAAQMGVASFVAWLTVRWALKRFKAEKSWERQLSIYTDLISALRNLAATLGRWRPHLDGTNPMSDETMGRLRERYMADRERISEALAAGLVLLPEDQALLISQIENDLNEHREDLTHEQALEREIEIVGKAFGEAVKAARIVLGTDTDREASFLRDPVSWIRYRNKLRLSFADEKQR